MLDLYAVGTVGQSIRIFVETTDLGMIRAQMRSGEIAVAVPDKTARTLTDTDAANALK